MANVWLVLTDQRAPLIPSIPHSSNQHDNEHRVQLLTDHGHHIRIFHPLDLLTVCANILKGLGVVDSKYEEEPFPCPHVLVPHRTAGET